VSFVHVLELTCFGSQGSRVSTAETLHARALCGSNQHVTALIYNYLIQTVATPYTPLQCHPHSMLALARRVALMSYSLLRPPVCSACARQLQGVRAAPHPSPRVVCPAHRCQPRMLCAASGDGPDGPSAVPEKFVNIRDILDDVGGTDFVFEDKEEGDVWAHEGRLAASPPAPEGAPPPLMRGCVQPVHSHIDSFTSHGCQRALACDAELEAKPEVKGALSPEAADILTAYSSEQGLAASSHPAAGLPFSWRGRALCRGSHWGSGRQGVPRRSTSKKVCQYLI